MRIRTLIVDDEPIALEKMKSYVGKTPYLELVGACQSASEAMTVLARESVDVVFTDINMPDLDGLEFISALPAPPMVVFVTAYAQYAVDGFRLSAVDYLLKPYSFADFQRAAAKVLERSRQREALREAALVPQLVARPATRDAADQPLFVKVDYRYVRVEQADIRYIKGYGEYLQIYMRGSQTPLLTLSSFAAIRERLDPRLFIQTHRSYIVNMANVERIEKSRVVMDADTYIPVSDGYRTEFVNYLAAHSIGYPSK